MPKQKRKREIHDLVTEWNEIVDQHERNALRQTQIIRRLKRLDALQDVQPIPYSLTAKPDGALS